MCLIIIIIIIIIIIMILVGGSCGNVLVWVLSFRHIAAQLQISLGTAYKLYARFEETRDVAPKKRGPRRDSGKLDEFHETYIICLLAENPRLYLSELCQRIHDSTGTTVSGSTVCRLLKRNNITRKNLFTLLDKDV